MTGSLGPIRLGENVEVINDERKCKYSSEDKIRPRMGDEGEESRPPEPRVYDRRRRKCTRGRSEGRVYIVGQAGRRVYTFL